MYLNAFRLTVLKYQSKGEDSLLLAAPLLSLEAEDLVSITPGIMENQVALEDQCEQCKSITVTFRRGLTPQAFVFHINCALSFPGTYRILDSLSDIFYLFSIKMSKTSSINYVEASTLNKETVQNF